MFRLPLRSNRPDPHFPHTTLFRSDRERDARQRVAQCDGGVGVPAGVDDDAGAVFPSGVDRVDEDALVVALHGAHLETALRGGTSRSEEHTSELQSLMRISYAVFCVKKKISRRRCTPQTN